MESKPVRTVNVVPITRLKRAPLPEDNDDYVACLICNKTFASEFALKNHGRIEHIDAVLNGQDLCVKNAVAGSTVKKDEKDKSLSGGDRKAKRAKTEKVRVKVTDKKDKEAKPIAGPFECLQPSTLASDGPCHQMFFSCCEYSVHHRDEHTRRRKGVKCQVCEKPLSACGTEQLPYTCQFCSVGFERSKELSEHVSLHHTKVKPFQCSLCTKRFTQQAGLVQHMRGHSGDRPYECTFCPKAFTQKSGLEQHLRIHTKVKPYKCVVCGKAFCQSVHLQQHMRTHTNVAPFQCIVCQKRFKQSSHLNYHLKYHNSLNMTDEQKEKYSELMKMMGKESIFELLDPASKLKDQVIHTSNKTGGKMNNGKNQEEVVNEELVVDVRELLEEDLGQVVEVVYLE